MPKGETMVKLLCKEEHRIELPDGRLEKYEDGYDYIYEVDEKKAEELLATGKFEQVE